MKNAAIYLLGSDDSTCDELQTFIASRGWRTTALYRDISTTQRRRPQWTQMIHAARRKHRPFDLIVATTVSDVVRSPRELVEVLGELHALGVDFVTYDRRVPLDSTTTSGAEVLRFLGAFGDVERARHGSRTRRGVARARRRGARVGRPPAVFDIVRARELRAADWSLRAIAAELGVPVAVLHRELAVSKPSAKTGRVTPRDVVPGRSVH